jgi:hypothetical protein
VLRVDQQPVVTAVGELFRNRWTVGVNEQPILWASFPQLGLKLFASQNVTHYILLLSFVELKNLTRSFALPMRLGARRRVRSRSFVRTTLYRILRVP